MTDTDILSVDMGDFNVGQWETDSNRYSMSQPHAPRQLRAVSEHATVVLQMDSFRSVWSCDSVLTPTQAVRHMGPLPDSAGGHFSGWESTSPLPMQPGALWPVEWGRGGWAHGWVLSSQGHGVDRIKCQSCWLLLWPLNLCAFLTANNGVKGTQLITSLNLFLWTHPVNLSMHTSCDGLQPTKLSSRRGK